MPEARTPISGLITAAQHAQVLASCDGDLSVSAKLRHVIGAGLLALERDEIALHAVVDELRATADRIASVSGRKTPAGAWWAPTADAQPDPELLAVGGDVVSCPDAVCLVRPGHGCLLFDHNLTLLSGDQRQSVPLDLPQLINLNAILPAALCGLSAGPGVRDLGNDLIISRDDDGGLLFTLRGGLIIQVRPGCGWLLSAELASLVARRIGHSLEQRAALDRQLQVAP